MKRYTSAHNTKHRNKVAVKGENTRIKQDRLRSFDILFGELVYEVQSVSFACDCRFRPFISYLEKGRGIEKRR